MGAGNVKSVNDYLTFSRLRVGHDPHSLQNDGVGYRLSEDGISTMFYHNGEEMRFLAYIEFGPGWRRGNHFHRQKVENLCVVRGKLLATYWLAERPESAIQFWLTPGDAVRILPGCAHSYVADEFAIALEFSLQPFDQADAVRVPAALG